MKSASPNQPQGLVPSREADVRQCNCHRAAQGHTHGCPFYVPTLDDRLRWFQYATNEYEAATRGSEREAHYAERIEWERGKIHELFAAGARDTARMDHLEAFCDELRWGGPFTDRAPTLSWFAGDGDSSETTTGATWREAIDAALANLTSEPT